MRALLICLFGAYLVSAVTGRGQQTTPVSAAAKGEAAAAGTLRFLAIDRHSNPIGGLQPEELALRVDRQPRKIVSLSLTNNEPRTIGIFFDTSGSRRFDKAIIREVQGIAKFLESVWRRDDGGFLVAFDDSARTLAKPTTDLQQIQAALQVVPKEGARGGTALYDALCSIRFGPQADDREKLFLVVSDFEDNSSRKSKQEMIQVMQREGVRVFILLRALEDDRHRESVTHDKKVAKEVAEKTGGDVFVVTGQTELDAAFQRLLGELEGAYRLNYEPLPSTDRPAKQELTTTRRDVDLLYARN